MRNVFEIFKRSKPAPVMPEPYFEDNWKQESFETNTKRGVKEMQKGKDICLFDDGRGYELAAEIKSRFILEYSKQLSEKIKISKSGGQIHISMKL